MRCLWITRDYPYPPDAGDVIYSSRLLEAFAAAGAKVTIVCRRRDGLNPNDPPPPPEMEWRVVIAPLRGSASAVFSRLPNAARRYDTPAMRAAVQEELERPWDVVLVDNLGAAWVLPLLRACWAGRRDRPILVYVSHNHEASTRRLMADNAPGNPLVRFLMRRDGDKVDPLERSMVEMADLITANTPADEVAYRADFPDKRYVVLTPGYLDRVTAERSITSAMPRQAIILGSFDWLAKRVNLAEFVEAADPLFADVGAELLVIGRGPEPWIDEMRGRLRATTFTGFVDEVTGYLDGARVGIVSERSGGGFKHKVLYYVFNRIPVAVLEGSIAGVPLVPGESLLSYPTVETLARGVLDRLDDVDELNRIQQRAFAQCAGAFDWADRGVDLYETLEELI